MRNKSVKYELLSLEAENNALKNMLRKLDEAFRGEPLKPGCADKIMKKSETIKEILKQYRELYAD